MVGNRPAAAAAAGATAPAGSTPSARVVVVPPDEGEPLQARRPGPRRDPRRPGTRRSSTRPSAAINRSAATRRSAPTSTEPASPAAPAAADPTARAAGDTAGPRAGPAAVFVSRTAVSRRRRSMRRVGNDVTSRHCRSSRLVRSVKLPVPRGCGGSVVPARPRVQSTLGEWPRTCFGVDGSAPPARGAVPRSIALGFMQLTAALFHQVTSVPATESNRTNKHAARPSDSRRWRRSCRCATAGLEREPPPRPRHLRHRHRPAPPDADARGGRHFVIYLPRLDDKPAALFCEVRHCRAVAENLHAIGARSSRSRRPPPSRSRRSPTTNPAPRPRRHRRRRRGRTRAASAPAILS